MELKKIIDYYKQMDDPSSLIGKDFNLITNSLSCYLGGRLIFTDNLFVYKILPTKTIIKSLIIMEFFKKKKIDKFLVPFTIIYQGKYISIIAQKKIKKLPDDYNSFKMDSSILEEFEDYNIPIPIKKNIIKDYPEQYHEIISSLKLFHIKDVNRNNCGILSEKIVFYDYEIHEKLSKDEIQIILTELQNKNDLIMQFLESLQ